MSIFHRLGFTETILSDHGSQFVSQTILSFTQMMSIGQTYSTIYTHAQMEFLNISMGGWKRCWRKLLRIFQSNGTSTYWLFVLHTERCLIKPQASVHMNLFWGRGGSDLGPLSILQDMWMKPDAAETNILYSLFADIRDMNITGRRLAWENLENADEITGEYIIKSCKVVTLKPEDEVLVILPDDSNTLLTTWQCLYTVVWHISNVDYIINVCSHHKVYNSTCLNYIPQGQSV